MDEQQDHSGELTQDALDALLAAAQAEEGSLGTLTEAEIEALHGGDTPLPAAFGGRSEEAKEWAAEPERPSPISLPSFDAPSLAFSAGGPDYGDGGISRVRDIPLELTVELGRTRMLIRDILDLGTGSIIELEKVAGEPVDLFANGLLVARGEVVVIDDNFGVRVTEIITAAERRQPKDDHARAA